MRPLVMWGMKATGMGPMRGTAPITGTMVFIATGMKGISAMACIIAIRTENITGTGIVTITGTGSVSPDTTGAEVISGTMTGAAGIGLEEGNPRFYGRC